jgi:hypothetical protein
LLVCLFCTCDRPINLNHIPIDVLVLSSPFRPYLEIRIVDFVVTTLAPSTDVLVLLPWICLTSAKPGVLAYLQIEVDRHPAPLYPLPSSHRAPPSTFSDSPPLASRRPPPSVIRRRPPPAPRRLAPTAPPSAQSTQTSALHSTVFAASHRPRFAYLQLAAFRRQRFAALHLPRFAFTHRPRFAAIQMHRIHLTIRPPSGLLQQSCIAPSKMTSGASGSSSCSLFSTRTAWLLPPPSSSVLARSCDKCHQYSSKALKTKELKTMALSNASGVELELYA